MTENKQPQSVEVLEDQIQQMCKVYNKKRQKLMRSERAAEARAYVQQRLREEAADARAYVQQRLREEAGQQAPTCQTFSTCKLQKKPGVYGGKKSSAVKSTLKAETVRINVHPGKSKHAVPKRPFHTEVIPPGSITETNHKHPDFVCIQHCDKNEETSEVNTDSQDIFTTPVNQEDTDVTSECSKVDHGDDSDPVIIVEGHEERNKPKCKDSGYMSKLKLSKYKTKNLVNPIEKKIKPMHLRPGDTVDSRQALGLDALKPVLSSFQDFNGAEDGAVVACVDLNTGMQSDPQLKDITVCKEQDGNGCVEQITLLRKTDKMENKENRLKKSRHSKITEEVDETIQKSIVNSPKDIVLTNSETSSTSQSSVSVENYQTSREKSDAKTRRRSGTRKRRSSTPGLQRRSSRLIAQSSDEICSQSTQSEITSPLFVNTNHTSAKKRVIISSVFQCLVDEGKRKNDVEEFNVPCNILNCKFKDKLKSECCSNLPEQTLTNTKSHVRNTEIGKEDLLKINTSSTESVLDNERTTSTRVSTESSVLSETENMPDKSEEEEVISPTLFESQSDTGIFTFQRDNDKGGVKSCDTTKQPQDEVEIQTKNVSNSEHLSSIESQAQTEKDCVATDIKESSLCLQQTACFQVPPGDNVQSVLCVEKVNNGHTQTYVVCLCSTCLKLYTLCDSHWTCVAKTKVGYISKRKSSLIYSIPDTDAVSVIVLGIRSDSTSINVYTYTQQDWWHTTLDTVFSKSVHVCPVSSGSVVVSYHRDDMTYVSKYNLDIESGQWTSRQIGRTDAYVTQLLTVTGIDAALLALTKSAHLHIWNHEVGYLLSTIDISDISPLDPVCPKAFSEQGLLFLPLLTKKKSLCPGSVIAINPYIGSSEVLTSIDLSNTWTGCSHTCVMSEGLLLCRQNNGCLRVWNVYSGDHLATVDDVTVTCFSATNHYCAIAHKQCIHLYTLNIQT